MSGVTAIGLGDTEAETCQSSNFSILYFVFPMGFHFDICV